MDSQQAPYPRFTLVPERGIIPDIGLPRNFRELVSRFYANGGKKRVERYVAGLQQMLKVSGNSLEIKLNWHDTDGLCNISVGTQGGLDLQDDHSPYFQEHNLGWYNGFFAAFVAMEYVLELTRR